MQRLWGRIYLMLFEKSLEAGGLEGNKEGTPHPASFLYNRGECSPQNYCVRNGLILTRSTEGETETQGGPCTCLWWGRCAF